MVMNEPASTGAARKPAAVPTLVYGALVRLLGRERADVLDFYVDCRLAAYDSARYERAVESLLGAQNGSLVISALRSELAKSGR